MSFYRWFVDRQKRPAAWGVQWFSTSFDKCAVCMVAKNEHGVQRHDFVPGGHREQKGKSG